MDPAIEAHDRPGRVIGTCFKYPGAGPEDIVGLDIGKHVSFGKCGPKSGLSAPEKVASGKPVSDIPIPTNPNYNGPSPEQQQKKKGIYMMMVTTVLVILGIIATGGLAALGAVVKAIK